VPFNDEFPSVQTHLTSYTYIYTHTYTASTLHNVAQTQRSLRARHLHLPILPNGPLLHRRLKLHQHRPRRSRRNPTTTQNRRPLRLKHLPSPPRSTPNVRTPQPPSPRPRSRSGHWLRQPATPRARRARAPAAGIFEIHDGGAGAVGAIEPDRETAVHWVSDRDYGDYYSCGGGGHFDERWERPGGRWE
jgi:hypothetical protein